MSIFEGFREGCPGEAWLGGYPSIHTFVRFQADGQPLFARDAGVREPDAIRIVPVDEQGASLYEDRVLAFTERAAEDEVARDDNHIPERNIRLIREEHLQRLSGLCNSCESGGPCAILNAAAQAYEDAPIPMTFKEVFATDLIMLLRDVGDPGAAYFRVHIAAPPELSDEELLDVVAIAQEMDWNASIAPIEKDGQSVRGIKIEGGHHYGQPE